MWTLEGEQGKHVRNGGLALGIEVAGCEMEGICRVSRCDVRDIYRVERCDMKGICTVYRCDMEGSSEHRV